MYFIFFDFFLNLLEICTGEFNPNKCDKYVIYAFLLNYF